MATEETNLYPLFLRLDGRPVLVVGAGEVAERKIDSLLAAGARVRVVAPEATDEVKWLAKDGGAVEWLARSFEPGDADGVWLVVAATSDADAQKRVAKAAEERRIFVVAVDDLPNGTAFSAATVRRPPFTIAISSQGETPALTRLVREILEQVLPGEDWIVEAKKLRAKWKAEQTPVGQRFGELVAVFAARAKGP